MCSSFVDCSVGTRPFYAWRSILHGRDLMKQGLVTSIGDGKSPNVWFTNRIVDSFPRPPPPPQYHLTNKINLALKVEDLLIEVLVSGMYIWLTAPLRLKISLRSLLSDLDPCTKID